MVLVADLTPDARWQLHVGLLLQPGAQPTEDNGEEKKDLPFPRVLAVELGVPGPIPLEQSLRGVLLVFSSIHPLRALLQFLNIVFYSAGSPVAAATDGQRVPRRRAGCGRAI